MSLPLTAALEAVTGWTNHTSPSRLWGIRVELFLILATVVHWSLAKTKQKVSLVLPKEPVTELSKGLRFVKLDEYQVPNLFRSSWAQFALLMLKWKTQNLLEPTKRQIVPLPHTGGDQIILDYFYPKKKTSGKMVLVVYLPGITGRLGEAIPFVERVLEKGWISVVFHRRGHAAPLIRPTFNIFGNPLDVRAAVESIARTEPNVPIALVGSSAGSAVMIRYIGEYADDPRVVAGVGLSPGYSITEIWKQIKGTFFDRFILDSAKKFFVARNRALLVKKNEEAVLKMEAASTVYEFATAAASFSADHSDADSQAIEHTMDEWFEKTDPVRYARNIKTPNLRLNALDDPVCIRQLVETVGVELTISNPYGAMIVTDYGAHCAHQTFKKGWKPENWGHTVALDFIEGVVSD